MSIPDSQLETWSGQGSITQSAATYNAIKNALEASDTDYSRHSYKVFLQGSYGNDTNIWAESDVDIVIQLTDAFNSDTTSLSESEKSLYKQAFADATYTLTDFKRDVLATLRRKYGSDVEEGTKAIAIKANGGRRKSDVIVATEYRRYIKFNGVYDSSYVEGIRFFNAAGGEIINYPKSHSINLTAKHQATSSRFKPTVRIMKNLRSTLVDKGAIEASLAPSYYLEGLFYNVPNDSFTSSYQDRIANALNWLHQCDKSKLLCANEQYYLLHDSPLVTWRLPKCQEFLAAAIKLWNEW
jgi:hypothetical protein